MPALNKFKVYLVDDHPLVRESLSSLINQQQDMIVCGEAGDSPTAQREIFAANPDIVIADLSLKEGSGLELVKKIKANMPKISVIVLSMHDETVYAERVIRAGAQGYLMKRETSKKIVEGIRQVIAGNIYVSDHMAGVFAKKFIGGKPAASHSPGEALSDRELEVFDLLGQGLETRRVAEILHVSIKTVQAYCARIKEKLGLANAAELFREAVRWHDQQSET